MEVLARRKVKPKYQITSVRRSSTTSLPEAPIEALPQTPGVQSATLSQRHRRPRLQASELQTPCTPRLTRALMHARMHGRMDAACMDSCMDAPTYLSYESMYALTGHACTTYLLLCLCFVLYHSLLALSLSLSVSAVGRRGVCLSLSLSVCPVLECLVSILQTRQTWLGLSCSSPTKTGGRHSSSRRPLLKEPSTSPPFFCFGWVPSCCGPGKHH